MVLFIVVLVVVIAMVSSAGAPLLLLGSSFMSITLFCSVGAASFDIVTSAIVSSVLGVGS